MLLLGLKALLFRKRAPDGLCYGTTTSTPPRSSGDNANNPNNPPSKTSVLQPLSRRSSDFSNTTFVDLEAQDTSRRKGSAEKGGFQINARVISDATIGLSDGLTVPFALTAGLSALGNTRVVIFGGLAELMAGAISMGLGGYLGAKSEMFVSPPLLPFLPTKITKAMGLTNAAHHTTKPCRRLPSSPRLTLSAPRQP